MTEATQTTAINERPLVTFALLTYNQEKYIREAVEGAFAQTYGPLEIILSDDSSTDSTFEIMEEMVAGYKGPHKVILNRNEINLGLGKHVNNIVNISLGELIVAAAGDDISLPNRTNLLFDAWIENGKPLVICSGFKKIDEYGVDIPFDRSTMNPDWLSKLSSLDFESSQALILEFLRWKLPGLYGSTSCWSRELFRKYPPLSGDVWYEDRVFFLRALLEKKLAYIQDELVFYRNHTSSFTNRPQNEKATSWNSIKQEEKSFQEKSAKRIGHLVQHLEDIQCLEKNMGIDESILIDLKKEIETQIDMVRIFSSWWKVSIFKRVLKYYPEIKLKSLEGEALWARNRLLPFRLFLIMIILKRNIWQR